MKENIHTPFQTFNINFSKKNTKVVSFSFERKDARMLDMSLALFKQIN